MPHRVGGQNNIFVTFQRATESVGQFVTCIGQWSLLNSVVTLAKKTWSFKVVNNLELLLVLTSHYNAYAAG